MTVSFSVQKRDARAEEIRSQGNFLELFMDQK